MLTAFDRSTKDAGYFNLDLQKKNGLEKLTMQPCWFDQLTKAKDADVYLVVKESADLFPNAYVSTDLINFTALTDAHPQKAYNWMTSELITWKQLDGQITQGILYKPENFDPKKKYPLIFYYYERISDEMHKFLMPGGEYPGAIIDVASFVSDGYLVMYADNHYKLGNPGQTAYNSMVGGAQFMSKFPWVDAKRMGLNGHSYGGYMTNYIITHSHLFAAAISASGWSNFISASNRIRQNGNYAQDYYEVGKQRMGGNMWEKPGNYIQASPIFQAHRVTTPVLLMSNKKDGDVDYYEGIQFYTVLRRMGKKCWMMQYDGEGHQLFDKVATTDFMIREKQFFDHYLKGAPFPRWMVEGIPATRKGTTLGYELEPAGTDLPANLLTPREQRNIDSLQKLSPPTVIVK